MDLIAPRYGPRKCLALVFAGGWAETLASLGARSRWEAGMEMHQVRYFLAVADELNFTRAAERCHVAQPSLTRAVKLLEEELGGPLFHRERANTHLSELGRMVKPYLEQVYGQAQRGQAPGARVHQAQEDEPQARGDVHDPAEPARRAGEQSSEPATPDRAGAQGCERGGAGAPAARRRSRGRDLLPAGRQPDERLHYMPLFREQFMIVLHPDHPLAKRNAVMPKDLTGERYLNRANCEFNGYAGPIWREHDFLGCELVYRSERDDWILAMIASGLGFGFMPASCANHPGVVVRPLVDPEFWREVNLVTVRGRPHSPAVGALVREAMRTRWMGGPALAAEAEQRREIVASAV